MVKYQFLTFLISASKKLLNLKKSKSYCILPEPGIQMAANIVTFYILLTLGMFQLKVIFWANWFSKLSYEIVIVCGCWIMQLALDKINHKTANLNNSWQLPLFWERCIIYKVWKNYYKKMLLIIFYSKKSNGTAPTSIFQELLLKQGQVN